MMKKFVFAISMLAALPVTAQETYENANIVTEDLNGTARFVGMGGAMDALGADISTIATNPAGLGLFRSSQVAVTAGMSMQQDAKDFHNASKAHANFDQIGFVWSKQNNERSFLNLSFNYHKSRDFNFILTAAQDNLSQRASQNALSYIKAVGDRDATGESTIAINEKNGKYYGDFYWTSQIDNLYYNAFIMGDGGAGFNMADGYLMNRANKGYIGEYDFSISGNINDRVYLGLTFGIQDVHYKGYSEYTENLVSGVGNTSVGSLTVSDERKITGTGCNFKIGAIFRPIEDSPFRFGLSFASPTFYDLTTSNYTYLINNPLPGDNSNYKASDSYDFRLNSPMKFGVSLGHTIGNYLAIGAGYEYADYGATNPRVKDGDYYDWYYDTYYSSSSKDAVMKDHTEATLKGVSTLKVGLEFKPIPEVAFRAGYNYVSPMYNSNGFKDVYLDSYGTNVASATDYTNWKSTNRLTLGVGYSYGKFFADLAYQYSMQKGDFYPFMDAYVDDYMLDDKGQIIKDEINNYATKTEVENNRHQLLLTLGYRF
ncbi:MAG: hemin receptor [Prevotella sp.]|nr:hemin receptor [Prevotella sp.]